MTMSSKAKNYPTTPLVKLTAIGMMLTIAVIINQSELVNGDQGCPFDNGSCKEYCNQQGCNLGYCGHFAWIQCICRKCGDEWSYYDKIRFNQNKTVNQTELESIGLKLEEPPAGSLPMLVMAKNNINGTTSEAIQTELITFDTIDDGLANTNSQQNELLLLDANSTANTTLVNSTTTTITIRGRPTQIESNSDNEVDDDAAAVVVVGNATTEINNNNGTLLVPDLTEVTTDDGDNDGESNELDENDTDKLLELAEKHYNSLKQQSEEKTTTTSTTPAPMVVNSATTNGNKRKRNTSAPGGSQIISMMYRI